ncbi:MAG: fasciclin domain-containing protein [Acidiferrobacterales bacterium]|nr:fasciclin domain-containing protein [Acidiferrobacterales bacterium]
MSKNTSSKPNRRKLLKTATSTAAIAAVASTDWAKPLVNSIVLPAHAQTSTQTITQIAVATDILSTLVSVLTPTQVELLNGPGPFTVFAPTNDAFANISDVVAGLTAEEVESVVNYHVVSGSVTFADIPATSGATPSLVTTVEASNGTVYVISEVLLPPSS